MLQPISGSRRVAFREGSPPPQIATPQLNFNIPEGSSIRPVVVIATIASNCPMQLSFWPETPSELGELSNSERWWSWYASFRLTITNAVPSRSRMIANLFLESNNMCWYRAVAWRPHSVLVVLGYERNWQRNIEVIRVQMRSSNEVYCKCVCVGICVQRS
jgi:hypothetical protein